MSAVQYTELEISSLKNDQDLLEAQREQKSLIRLLNMSTGRPLEASLVPVHTAFQDVDFIDDIDHYFAIAVHRYPLLRKGQALLEAANAAEKISKNQGLFNPKIFLFGSVEWSQGLGTTKPESSWSLGTGVIVPLFDGHRSYSEFEKTTLLVAQSRIGYEEAERKLKIEIAESLNRLQQSKLQRSLAQKSVLVARARLEETRRAVGSELLPQYRFDEALAKYAEAEIAVIIAEAEQHRWQTKLQVLTGESLLASPVPREKAQ